MKHFYLLLFLLLCSLTISQSVIAQGNPLDHLIRDTNDFIVDRVMTSNNSDCGSHFLDTLLNYTTLGTLMSESFRMTFDFDMMNLLRRDPSSVIKMTQVSQENIQRYVEWLERRAQNTTQEKIDEMRKDLDGMEAVWDFCLRHPDKIVLNN